MRVLRSSDLVGVGLVGLVGGGLLGCGSATPAPATPVAETAVVNLDAPAPAGTKPKATPAETGTRAKGEEGTMGELAAARKAALQDVAELEQSGILGALTGNLSGDLTSVLDEFSAGVVSGGGGLGLRGVGVGGGGTGGAIGLGTIGTGSGFGPGSRSVTGVTNSVYSNPIGGQSVYATSTAVVELGDAAVLGLSAEQAARALRERVYRLRDCYADRRDGNPALAGSVTFRIVVGVGGRVVFARALASDLGDAEAVACMTKELKELYVGSPLGGQFGVVEAAVSFRPPATK